MKNKLELIRRRNETEAETTFEKGIFKTVIKLDEKKQITALEAVKDEIASLYELINGKEDYDFNKLAKQLEVMNEKLNFDEQLTSIQEEIKNKKIDTSVFTAILKAIESNRPLPVKIDLEPLHKAIVDVSQRIQEQSTVSQATTDFTPVRRVIKVGNRLVFDDQPTPTRGGGGGGGSSDPTVYHVPINQSGAGADTLVSAQTDLYIKVVAYAVVLGSSGSVQFSSGATAVTGAMPFVANGGISAVGTNKTPLFQTSKSEALIVTTVGAAAKGHLSYILE